MSNLTRMDKHRQAQLEEQRKRQEKQQKKQSFKSYKPKKQRGFFGKLVKALVILLVVLTVYSGIFYAKGYFSAKGDTSIQKTEVSAFNGLKSSNGVNVLLLGSDSRGEDRGRSDSIMVAHYDHKSKTPKLVSFMRDTYVGIPNSETGGVDYDKLNAAYSYGGPELVRQTLAQTFGLDIQYYAIVNFESFPQIIDTLAPRGLEINAEKDLEVDGVVVHQGVQRMDGTTALQYARFRKDEEGDFGRVRRQQQVMNALFKQGLSPKNFLRLPETVGKVQGYTASNIPVTFYASTGLSYLSGFAKPLEKLTIPVDGTWSNGYYDHAGSVLEIDESANSSAIQAFFNQ